MKERFLFRGHYDYEKQCYAFVEVHLSRRMPFVSLSMTYESYRRLLKRLSLNCGDYPVCVADTHVSIYRNDGSYFGLINEVAK